MLALSNCIDRDGLYEGCTDDGEFVMTMPS